MTKFTVIKGGGQGPPDRHAAMARHHLHMLIVETLRTLARGTDPEERVSTHLEQLIEHLMGTDIAVKSVVDDVVTDLNEKLNHRDKRDLFEEETETIVLSALQVAAEALVSDPAAKGRLSGRRQRLRQAIEHQIQSRKRRSAECASHDRYSEAMERLRHLRPTSGALKAGDRAPAHDRGVKKGRQKRNDEAPPDRDE